MEEPTTTEAAPDTTGVEQINGVAVDESGRAIADEETTQPSGADEQTAESEPTETSSSVPFDDGTLAWAESKGIDLQDPAGVAKVVQSYREAEKQLHKTSQERSDLQRLVETGQFTPESDGTDISELRSKVAQMELENQVNSFWTKNPEAREFEGQMVDILEQRPHLANDLEALYAVARINSGADKLQGGKEALEQLANKQKASTISGSATNPTSKSVESITPQNVDQLVASHDQAWFEKNYDTIRKAMEQ